VRTVEFVQAVAWCREPEVKAALISVFQRTGDPDLLLATLPALDRSQWSLVRERLTAALRAQPKDARGWYGEGYQILVALRRTGGDAAKPIYREYLRGGSAQRCGSVCEALKETHGEWDREFLVPLLSDKRESNTYSHGVIGPSGGPSLPIRVCDQAAAVLCAHRKDLKFEMIGSFAELDRQIRILQERLHEAPSR
jgi:hypothetical protein